MTSAKRSSKKKAPVEKGAPAAKPKVLGVTSKLGVSETWVQVFEQNEQCDPDDRRTDPQISEFMKSEFPDLDAVSFDRVEIARGKYNRGGFHKKDKGGKVVRPKILSKSHDAEDDSSSTARSDSKSADATPRSSRVVSHKKDFKSHKK